jgi:hypothetical protein
MDLAPGEALPAGEAPGAGGGAGGGGDGSTRPLEQEPLLAARIMIEDCMCLVLDVLDIDQIFVAAAGGEGLGAEPSGQPGNQWKLLLVPAARSHCIYDSG